MNLLCSISDGITGSLSNEHIVQRRKHYFLPQENAAFSMLNYVNVTYLFCPPIQFIVVLFQKSQNITSTTTYTLSTP